MARKRSSRPKKLQLDQRGTRGPRGTRGARGVRGAQGPPGPAGRNGDLATQLGAILARVTQELEGIQNVLKIQFTRIAELQADLDDIRRTLSKAAN